MPDWYRSVDVVVMNSIAEGHGTPIFESVAMRRPVLSVRTGCAHECRLEGVTWYDTQAELVKLLRDMASPRIPYEFTWPSVAAGFRAIYREMTQ
jgi:glycosyltransferase involved in cell wall biosynthesis